MKPVFLLLCALLCLQACVPLPQASNYPERRIDVAAGPEDMVLDDYGPQKRILISCSDNRCKKDCPDGHILSYTPATGAVDTLPRFEEPGDRVFHPHGIDLVQIDDKLFLYVISHDNAQNIHRVARYRVLSDGLYWTHDIYSEHFRSPNALSVSPDGTVYVSNDRYNRNSSREMLLRQKKATVVRCPHNGKCEVVATHVAFGNGVVQQDGFLYQASTTGNLILRYVQKDNTLSERSIVAKLTGPDNLRWQGQSLLVACHLRGFAFIRHMNNPKKRAPTTVYRVPLDGGQAEVLYANRGHSLSAGSTALLVDGKLYICQVFEPWVLEVDLGKENN